MLEQPDSTVQNFTNGQITFNEFLILRRIYIIVCYFFWRNPIIAFFFIRRNVIFVWYYLWQISVVTFLFLRGNFVIVWYFLGWNSLIAFLVIRRNFLLVWYYLLRRILFNARSVTRLTGARMAHWRSLMSPSFRKGPYHSRYLL